MNFNRLLYATLTLFTAFSITCAHASESKTDDDYKVIVSTQGDKSYIISNVQKKSLLLSDINSTTETISIHNNNKYSAIKESFTSNRDKTIVIFDENFKAFGYIYLSSRIDFNTNKRYWSGFYCASNGVLLKTNEGSFFEQSYKSICKTAPEPKALSYEYNAQDNIFSIPVSGSETVKEIKLIALDSEKNGNVNIYDFGCIENCPTSISNTTFTGRIKNYKIKMHLSSDGGNISGYYYYDKYKNKISLTGTKTDKAITLYTKDDNENTVEEFYGELLDGHFSGIWSDIKSGKQLAFELYMNLI